MAKYNKNFGGPFDSKTLMAVGGLDDQYVVMQIILTERFFGTGSAKDSLSHLQEAINLQASRGYRLHSFSTTSSGSKGFHGGDKIQCTMIFERID